MNKLSFRVTWRLWAVSWAPAYACRILKWKWGLQVGPFSLVKKL